VRCGEPQYRRYHERSLNQVRLSFITLIFGGLRLMTPFDWDISVPPCRCGVSSRSSQCRAGHQKGLYCRRSAVRSYTCGNPESPNVSLEIATYRQLSFRFAFTCGDPDTALMPFSRTYSPSPDASSTWGQTGGTNVNSRRAFGIFPVKIG
jgi:hypothetical protein